MKKKLWHCRCEFYFLFFFFMRAAYFFSSLKYLVFVPKTSILYKDAGVYQSRNVHRFIYTACSTLGVTLFYVLFLNPDMWRLKIHGALNDRRQRWRRWKCYNECNMLHMLNLLFFYIWQHHRTWVDIDSISITRQSKLLFFSPPSFHSCFSPDVLALATYSLSLW